MAVIKDAWLKWKTLRLPWRKKFLVGQDLAGNTFWEFKDVINTGRFRRIVQYNEKTHHSDVQVSPQWHQWLRQTRMDPPSLQEQAADVARQAQLKQNAMLADQRWAAKAKYIESPKTRPEEAPTFARPDPTTRPENVQSSTHPAGGEPAEKQKGTAVNPGSEWQPEAWSPGPARPRNGI